MSDEMTKNQAFNFLAVLTTCAGNATFMKDLKIPYHEKGLGKPSEMGVTFVGRGNAGHFHFKNKEEEGDSYTRDWQKRGTNGACQTYAIMGYMGMTENLKSREYIANLRSGLIFLSHHAEHIASIWGDVLAQMQKSQRFDYPFNKLNAEEIRQDITKLIQDEHFLNEWLTDEFLRT